MSGYVKIFKVKDEDKDKNININKNKMKIQSFFGIKLKS